MLRYSMLGPRLRVDVCTIAEGNGPPAASCAAFLCEKSSFSFRGTGFTTDLQLAADKRTRGAATVKRTAEGRSSKGPGPGGRTSPLPWCHSSDRRVTATPSTDAAARRKSHVARVVVVNHTRLKPQKQHMCSLLRKQCAFVTDVHTCCNVAILTVLVLGTS